MINHRILNRDPILIATAFLQLVVVRPIINLQLEGFVLALPQ